VLQSLYDLVDRRHGADGETVARLAVREDSRVVDELDLRDRFRRDLEADRAISLVEDLRYHAGERKLVTDGGVDQRANGDDETGRGSSGRKGGARRCVPLTWCAGHTKILEGLDEEKFAGNSRLITDGGRNPDDNLARVADALDMERGRSRIPYEKGGRGINTLSSQAIRDVTLQEGDDTAVLVEIEMVNAAGVYQVDNLLKAKLRDSTLEDHVRIVAINTKEESGLVERIEL